MNRKKLHLEFLRIIACFFVIFNHSGAHGYTLYELYDPATLRYWLSLFVSVFCKVSVPVFFAISGALLLDREETLAEILKKRVLKTALLILLFSLFYYLVSLESIRDFSPFMFFGVLYTYNWNHSFWFLYSYIGFLLCLPFLRSLVRSLKNEYFIYLFIISLIFDSLWPVADCFLWKGEHWFTTDFGMAWACSQIFLYPCLGYYIEKRMDISSKKKWLLPLWLVNIAALSLSCFATYFMRNVGGEYANVFYSYFTSLNVVCLFITAKYMFSRENRRTGADRLTVLLGGCTLGIYLLHIYFLTYFPFTDRVWSMLDILFPAAHLIAAFIMCSAVFAAGCLVTLLMKKIPYLNRLL